MNIKLIYFNFAFWRAEISRISLFHAGIKFEDVRISSEDFAYIKAYGTLPDGTPIPTKALPCLTVNGVSICQTGAIARYCGKLSGLYPKDDALACASIDQILDTCTDLTNALSFPPNIEIESDRKSFRKSLLQPDGKLTKYFSALNLLDKNYNTVVKNLLPPTQFTVADLAIWGIVRWFKSGLIDYIPDNLSDLYPDLILTHDKISKNKTVIEWLSKTK